MYKSVLSKDPTVEPSRQRIREWFIDNFDNGAILSFRTSSKQSHRILIERGFPGRRPGNPFDRFARQREMCFLRSAIDIGRDKDLVNLHYIGLNMSIWTFTFYRADLSCIHTTNPLIDLTLSPITKP